MTLIKLDNGDYIVEEYVTRIYTEKCLDLVGDRGFHDEIRVALGSVSTEITPADRDRIAKAMTPKKYEPITMKRNHNLLS